MVGGGTVYYEKGHRETRAGNSLSLQIFASARLLAMELPELAETKFCFDIYVYLTLSGFCLLQFSINLRETLANNESCKIKRISR